MTGPPRFALQYYLCLIGGLLIIGNTFYFIGFFFPILMFSLGLAIVLLSRLFHQSPEKHVAFGYAMVALSLVTFFTIDRYGNALFIPGMLGAGLALVGGVLSIGLAGPHIGEPPTADSLLCFLGGTFIFGLSYEVGFGSGAIMVALYGIVILFCGIMLYRKPERHILWGLITVAMVVPVVAGYPWRFRYEGGIQQASYMLALAGGIIALISNRLPKKPATIPQTG